MSTVVYIYEHLNTYITRPPLSAIPPLLIYLLYPNSKKTLSLRIQTFNINHISAIASSPITMANKTSPETRKLGLGQRLNQYIPCYRAKTTSLTQMQRPRRQAVHRCNHQVWKYLVRSPQGCSGHGIRCVRTHGMRSIQGRCSAILQGLRSLTQTKGGHNRSHRPEFRAGRRRQSHHRLPVSADIYRRPLRRPHPRLRSRRPIQHPRSRGTLPRNRPADARGRSCRELVLRTPRAPKLVGVATGRRGPIPVA